MMSERQPSSGGDAKGGTGVFKRSGSSRSEHRQISAPIWVVSLAVLISAVVVTSAYAGMPTRGGAGQSLVDPPNKAILLPKSLSEAYIITADQLLTTCTNDAEPGKIACEDVVGGVDHRAVANGARNNGSTVLQMRGIESGAKGVRGDLYASVIFGFGLAPETLELTFGGQPVTVSLVATTTEPCWGMGGEIAVYKGSVTTLLTPVLNGDYAVSGIPSALTGDEDPWSIGLQNPPFAEGAALVVVYAHASIPWGSMVAVHDGAVDLFAPLDDQQFVDIEHPMSLPFPEVVDGVIRHSRIAADGQDSFRSASAPYVVSPTVELKTWLGPDSNTVEQIRGAESSYSKAADFNGSAGGATSALMDAESSFLPAENNLLLLEGKSGYTVKYELDLDYLAPSCAPAGAPLAPEFAKTGSSEVKAQVHVLLDCVTVMVDAITVR